MSKGWGEEGWEAKGFDFEGVCMDPIVELTWVISASCKVQGTLRCCEVRHSRKVAHICSHRIPLREPAKRVFMHANSLVYSTVGRGGSGCCEFISDKQSFNRQ